MKDQHGSDIPSMDIPEKLECEIGAWGSSGASPEYFDAMLVEYTDVVDQQISEDILVTKPTAKAA
jgi:hypothetical protein